MSSAGTLARLWHWQLCGQLGPRLHVVWTKHLLCGLLVTLGLRTLGLRWTFRVQTKLVAIVVSAAFVAELRHLLGLGLHLDYVHRSAATALSSIVCLRVSKSMVL